MIKIKKITYIYIILMYLLILQPFLENNISIFSYMDEVLALAFLFFLIVKIIKKKGVIRVSKINLLMIVSLFILLCIGLISNIIYKYQQTKSVFFDVVLVYKFFFVYFGTEVFFKDKIFENRDKIVINKNVKVITMFLAILTIFNYVFDIFPYSEIRFGIKSNVLFFGHPSGLASTCVFLIANSLIFGCNAKHKYGIIFILLLLIVSTLRMKAIAFAIIATLVIIYVNKLNKKIKLNKIIIVGLICVIVAFEQIQFYFIENNQTARGELLRTSFEIANDYFPLGTGFGTFASHFSEENYSPIYEIYGINNVWGLSEDFSAFISDSFWPMIIGQFGYIGTVLYMICIITIYLKIQKGYSKENKEVYIAKLLTLLYLLISSAAESAFVNPLAIPLAIILAI